MRLRQHGGLCPIWLAHFTARYGASNRERAVIGCDVPRIEQNPVDITCGNGVCLGRGSAGQLYSRTVLRMVLAIYSECLQKTDYGEQHSDAGIMDE